MWRVAAGLLQGAAGARSARLRWIRHGQGVVYLVCGEYGVGGLWNRVGGRLSLLVELGFEWLRLDLGGVGRGRLSVRNREGGQGHVGVGVFYIAGCQAADVIRGEGFLVTVGFVVAWYSIVE